MLVAQNPDTTRLHHQTEWEGEIVSQPSLGECSRGVAMCHQDDILRLAVVHMRRLDLADFLDQGVEARRQFCRRSGGMLVEIQTSFGTADAILLSTLTSISPDVPLLVLVKATFFAQRPDVFGDATFIVAGFLHQQVPLNCHDRLLAYP